VTGDPNREQKNEKSKNKCNHEIDQNGGFGFEEVEFDSEVEAGDENGKDSTESEK
jgi:hypothetical protein